MLNDKVDIYVSFLETLKFLYDNKIILASTAPQNLQLGKIKNTMHLQVARFPKFYPDPSEEIFNQELILVVQMFQVLESRSYFSSLKDTLDLVYGFYQIPKDQIQPGQFIALECNRLLARLEDEEEQISYQMVVDMLRSLKKRIVL